MIDSLRVVHDTLYVKGADAYDLLQKVNAFYDSAWNKLALFIGLFVTLIGLAVPLVSNYFLSRKINRDSEQIKADIRSEFKETQELARKLTEELKQVDNRVKGSSKYMESINNANQALFTEAYVSSLQAVAFFAKSGDFQNIPTLLDNMERFLSPANKKQIDVIVRRENKANIGVLSAIDGLAQYLQNESLVERLLNMKKVIAEVLNTTN